MPRVEHPDVPRLPGELGYLRVPAATYGVFFTLQDKVVLAGRLPRPVRAYLADVAGRIVSNQHLALIEDFIRKTPPRVSFVNYESCVFSLLGLFRILYELGDDRFRAVSQGDPGYVLALGFAEVPPHTVPRPDLRGMLEHILTSWKGIQGTDKGPDDPNAVLLTPGLGPHFEPWVLPDAITQAESLHAIVLDRRSPWPRRRDAAVLLCNAPAETAEEARELVLALSRTAVRCECYPIVYGMWARAKHVGRLLLSSDEPWVTSKSLDERLEDLANCEDLSTIQSLAAEVVRYYTQRQS